MINVVFNLKQNNLLPFLSFLAYLHKVQEECCTTPASALAAAALAKSLTLKFFM